MSIPEPRFSPAMGAPCQMRDQGQFPVWCITALDHTQILFSNIGTEPRVWVITGGTVYQQRFWASSTATIHLSCSLPTVHDVPPPFPLYYQGVTPPEPDVIKEEPQSRNTPTPFQASGILNALNVNQVPAQTQERKLLQFQAESEISIWAGYIPVMRPITVDDIESNRLTRIFVGIVDTISTVGTSKGVTASIQCRDRMRYLQDTEVSFDPSYSDKNVSTLAKAFSKDGENILRSSLIVKAAQLGIGYVDVGADAEPCNINGRIIKPGYVQDLGTYLTNESGEVTSGDSSDLVDTGTTGAPGAFVGLVGNTGASKGPHVHIQYHKTLHKQKGAPPPLSSHMARFAVNGRVLTSWPKTSGYGPRWGRMHYGIDFGCPSGARITVTVPVKGISYVPGYNLGAGNLSTIRFPDGVVMQIFHLRDDSKKYF